MSSGILHHRGTKMTRRDIAVCAPGTFCIFVLTEKVRPESSEHENTVGRVYFCYTGVKRERHECTTSEH